MTKKDIAPFGTISQTFLYGRQITLLQLCCRMKRKVHLDRIRQRSQRMNLSKSPQLEQPLRSLSYCSMRMKP